MVRNYKRKTQPKYRTEDLSRAVEVVKTGIPRLSLRSVAQVYQIPVTTLACRVKGTRGSKSGTYGRSTALPVEVELILANVLTAIKNSGFDLTRKQVLNSIGRYLNENNIQTRFAGGCPSSDWLYAFLKRHNLTIKNEDSKKPNNLAQTTSMDSQFDNVEDLFSFLMAVEMNKQSIKAKYDNIDSMVDNLTATQDATLSDDGECLIGTPEQNNPEDDNLKTEEELEVKYSLSESFQASLQSELRGRRESPSFDSEDVGKCSNTTQTQTEDVCQETEFDVFCRSIAMQLNSMPLRSALICQQKLQSLMSFERIQLLQQDSLPFQPPD